MLRAGARRDRHFSSSSELSSRLEKAFSAAGSLTGTGRELKEASRAAGS
jgi:hypothetical protein